MEIVVIEKKAFEAFMADVSSLTEKVNRLCSQNKERRLRKWMDGEAYAACYASIREHCKECVTRALSPARR